MSADTRSVSTDALETLGTIIPEGCGRDAIHVAVEPCLAGEKLFAGQHVGLLNGTAFTDPETIGIVDPFLSVPVFPGERFWMLLYPRTITSLRHVWSHPAFDAVPDPQPAKAVSEAWLRAFCKTEDCPGYETVMAAVTGGPLPENVRDFASYRNDGEYLHFDGLDAHSEIPPEFWDHVEVVTGNKIGQGKRAAYFSCSC